MNLDEREIGGHVYRVFPYWEERSWLVEREDAPGSDEWSAHAEFRSRVAARAYLRGLADGVAAESYRRQAEKEGVGA